MVLAYFVISYCYVLLCNFETYIPLGDKYGYDYAHVGNTICNATGLGTTSSAPEWVE